jgi:hypothetical protein
MDLPLNPDVSPATIAHTICVSGWTKGVRPPTSWTNGVKYGLMAKAGIPRSKSLLYELDHRIPIELGGAPKDPANLWLQPWVGVDGARAKDVLETALKRGVCAGRVPLASAQTCMAGKWQTCRVLLK